MAGSKHLHLHLCLCDADLAPEIRAARRYDYAWNWLGLKGLKLGFHKVKPPPWNYLSLIWQKGASKSKAQKKLNFKKHSWLEWKLLVTKAWSFKNQGSFWLLWWLWTDNLTFANVQSRYLPNGHPHDNFNVFICPALGVIGLSLVQQVW